MSVIALVVGLAAIVYSSGRGRTTVVSRSAVVVSGELSVCEARTVGGTAADAGAAQRDSISRLDDAVAVARTVIALTVFNGTGETRWIIRNSPETIDTVGGGIRRTLITITTAKRAGI